MTDNAGPVPRHCIKPQSHDSIAWAEPREALRSWGGGSHQHDELQNGELGWLLKRET